MQLCCTFVAQLLTSWSKRSASSSSATLLHNYLPYVADEMIRYFKTFCRRLSETSAHRCLFETSDSRYPAQDLQTYLKKIAKKSTSFRVFSLPTFYRVSRLPTSFRVPPADLLEIFIFLLTSFRDLHLPTTFRDFCLPTTLSGPSHVFLEKLRKK